MRRVCRWDVDFVDYSRLEESLVFDRCSSLIYLWSDDACDSLYWI